MRRNTLVCLALAACNGPQATAYFWSSPQDEQPAQAGTCTKPMKIMSPTGCKNKFKGDRACLLACQQMVVKTTTHNLDEQKANITDYCEELCETQLLIANEGRVITVEEREECATECIKEQSGDQEEKEKRDLDFMIRFFRGVARKSQMRLDALNYKSMNLLGLAAFTGMLAGAWLYAYHQTSGRTKECFMWLTGIFVSIAVCLFVLFVAMYVQETLV